MNQSIKVAFALSGSLLLAACGSEDEAVTADTSALARASDVTAENQTYKSLVGIDASESYAYYDLDTDTQLDLDDDSAKSNTEWDLAFYSTNIIVNGGYSGPGSVEASFTGNNTDFREGTDEEIATKFIDATPESEINDFLSVTEYASDTEFSTDEFTTVFSSDFYSYNFVSHAVTENDAQTYLVANSDGAYKVRVTNLATDASGFAIGELTFGVQFKGESDEAFSEEQLVVLAECSTQSYVDLSGYQSVNESDEWDLTVLCDDFEVQLGTDVTARKVLDDDDLDHIVGYVGTEYEGYYLTSDYANTVFKHQFKWYEYNLNLENKIWTQYGVYLVKTPTATYKFQPTGYYNLVGGEVTGRQISFIYDTVSEAAAVAE